MGRPNANTDQIRCLDNEDQNKPCKRCSELQYSDYNLTLDQVGEACVYEPAKRRGRRPIVRCAPIPAPSDGRNPAGAEVEDKPSPTMRSQSKHVTLAPQSPSSLDSLARASMGMMASSNLLDPTVRSPPFGTAPQTSQDGMRHMYISEQLDPGSTSSAQTQPVGFTGNMLHDAGKVPGPDDPSEYTWLCSLYQLSRIY